MREIVQVNVGLCGVRVGTGLLEKLCFEHNLDPTGSHIPRQEEQIGSYFAEKSSGLFEPRTVLFDLDPDSIDASRASLYGHLVPPTQCVSGYDGTGNNWAKGYYTEGAEKIDQLLDVVRIQTEKCESLQAFQLLYSLGGGTGSGVGSLLLSKLQEEQPKQTFVNCAVLPSRLVSDTVVEPYSAVLGLAHLTEEANIVVALDNERLFEVFHTGQGLATPSYSDLNHILTSSLANCTAPFRFGNAPFPHSWRQLATSLVPFPRLHYLSISDAPLLSRNAADTPTPLVEELVAQIRRPQNCLTYASAVERFFSSLVLFRGPYSQHSCDFPLFPGLDFIPDSEKVWSSQVPPAGRTAGVTLMANATAVQTTLHRLLTAFSRMYYYRSFLHRWTGEGMDELELTEAEVNLTELVSEYQQYSSAFPPDS